jgi:hypothetical protein
MRTTKTNVLIETTNRVHGMLEQGGVSGLVVSYPIADVTRVTGMSIDQIKDADELDDCPGYVGLTIKEALEYNLVGRVVRRGHIIQ